MLALEVFLRHLVVLGRRPGAIRQVLLLSALSQPGLLAMRAVLRGQAFDQELQAARAAAIGRAAQCGGPL